MNENFDDHFFNTIQLLYFERLHQNYLDKSFPISENGIKNLSEFYQKKVQKIKED